MLNSEFPGAPEQSEIVWENFGPDGSRVSGWNRYRSRGLAHAKERIGDLAETVRRLLDERERVRILEVGCGFARALIELKQLFGGRIETHGLNVEPAWDAGLVERYAAEEFGVAGAGAAGLAPAIHIADANEPLPFQNDSFHLVFSQHSFQFIADKLRLLEDIHRILAAGGMARIDLNDCEPANPEEFRYRIDIWCAGHRLDVMDYLAQHTPIAIERSRLRPDGYVVVRKRGNLRFEARLVGAIPLHEIWHEWGGLKSIYTLPAPEVAV